MLDVDIGEDKDQFGVDGGESEFSSWDIHVRARTTMSMSPW